MQKNFSTYLKLCTKVSVRWIIIHIKCKTKAIKLLEDTIGAYLCDTGLGKDFISIYNNKKFIHKIKN